MATGTAVDVVMPQMGVSVSEGTVTKWLKSVGDQVDAGLARPAQHDAAAADIGEAGVRKQRIVDARGNIRRAVVAATDRVGLKARGTRAPRSDAARPLSFSGLLCATGATIVP